MRLADDSHRHAIYGMTGSGKTTVGLYWLARRSWTRRPWVILDFKGDKIIERIPRLEEIDPRRRVPKRAGLYVARPLPDDDVQDLLWSIWKQERTGLFVDEAYMLTPQGRRNPAFNAILTQGRSKAVPVIELSQRPTWLSPFAMSEADFHQTMHLSRPDDVKRVEDWIPSLADVAPPDFQAHDSYYYDVARHELTHLAAVPDEEEILDRFDRRMPPRAPGWFALPSQRRLTA